jgi:glycosyltransferase involved in cell wall biosynthesis
VTVTVAIPVHNGGGLLGRLLAAVRSQQLQREIELVVCDSGSTDGSVETCRSHGAEVIQIAPEQFSHGGTRNLLMERSHGAHVAFLTQDAVPAGDRWLEQMLSGFSLTDGVGLVYGPYLPRPAASPMVARELHDWFSSIAPDSRPRIDRLASDERAVPSRELLGARGFFTDANGCVSRTAWEVVPFRSIRYAEDHALAHDMLRAGFAKVFVPDAAVVHSHDYSAWDWLRRSFDEARAVNEIYGFAEPLELRRAALKIRGGVGADWRWQRDHTPGSRALGPLARSTAHHSVRMVGALLGARAQRLPDAAVRALSLEGTD